MGRFYGFLLCLCAAAIGCVEADFDDEPGAADGWETEGGDDGGEGEGDDGGAGESSPAPGSGPAPGSDPDPAPGPAPLPPAATGACASFDLVWPTTGTASEQTLVHDAYGPRLLGDSYDWHRGIDLPGRVDDEGFHDPVRAVADGSIWAIGNRPNPGTGALAGYSKSAGNVIVLEHREADLHPGAETLYSVYMHLDTLELAAFPARLGGGGELVELDLREFYYLDGPETKHDNRGRRRSHFKTGGAPIETYPRVEQSDLLARIGDSGATYEHLHFELRAGSPSSLDARNPFAYLPHLDMTLHEASLEIEAGVARAVIEIPRAPGSPGATTGLDQQLDVETVALQLLDQEGAVLDELRFDFVELGELEDPDQPQHTLDGVALTLAPADFDSGDAVWRLELEFAALDQAQLVPGPGQEYGLEVVDVCGNRIALRL